MKTEPINLTQGKIEALKVDNIICLSVYGNFIDDDLKAVTQYMDNFFAEINKPTIRIWDLTHMNADQYQLTPHGIDMLNHWADKAKKKWPGNVAYIIGEPNLIFGMSRMYEIKASDDLMRINVLKSFADLPEEIKIRISEKLPGETTIQ